MASVTYVPPWRQILYQIQSSVQMGQSADTGPVRLMGMNAVYTVELGAVRITTAELNGATHAGSRTCSSPAPRTFLRAFVQ
jgi:hypothetical protein